MAIVRCENMFCANNYLAFNGRFCNSCQLMDSCEALKVFNVAKNVASETLNNHKQSFTNVNRPSEQVCMNCTGDEFRCDNCDKESNFNPIKSSIYPEVIYIHQIADEIDKHILLSSMLSSSTTSWLKSISHKLHNFTIAPRKG